MISFREEVRANFKKYSANMTPKQEAVIKLRAKGIMWVDIAKQLGMQHQSIYRIIKNFLDKHKLSDSKK